MKKTLFLTLAAFAALVGCATTPQRTTYYSDRPQPRPVYAQPQPVYTQPAPVQPVQEDYNKKVIKQGLMGAATGAIAAEVSGGKAGTGALVGAGTNVIGGALFDMLTAPPQQQAQPQYAQQYTPYVDQWNTENQNKKKIIRKYDSHGNIVSEEEVWQ